VTVSLRRAPQIYWPRTTSNKHISIDIAILLLQSFPFLKHLGLGCPWKWFFDLLRKTEFLMKYTEFHCIFTVKFPCIFCIRNSICFLTKCFSSCTWPILTYTIGKRRETHEYTWKCLGIRSMWCGGLDMPTLLGPELQLNISTPNGQAAPVLVLTKRILCCSGHVYTKGAWAVPERVCLHYRVICCTWGY
jgi:hypothetical protein